MKISGAILRRSTLAATVAGALSLSLLAAAPAEAAEYGIKTAPSAFGASASASRITFTWARPTSKAVQKVKYTVTIAGNRDMNRDANYQVKTVYGYTRTSTRTTTRDSAVFSPKAPTAYTYGARIWVKVVTSTIRGKYKKADPQKATNRYSAGLQPANPDPAKDLRVTPTCKGFTARWNTMPERSRGMKVEVAGSDGTQSFVGYEPARSIAISSLKSGADYRVRAQATSVKQRSAWTDWESVKTLSCARSVVRVGSYNTQVYRANSVAWSTRAPKVAAQIKGTDLDVVGLQETPAISGNQLPTLLSKLGRSVWNVADDTLGGVHLIYRKDRFNLVGSSEYDNKNNAIAVAQGFEGKGGSTPPFIAVSLHSTAGKQSEVQAAVALAERLQRSERALASAPVIFVGDIVLASGDDKRTAVRAELSKTLSDTEFYKPGRALDLYNSRNALIKCPPHVSGVKVDGIFTSDSAAATSWYMPKYGFSKGCFRSGFPSDHNLITSNVWLAN